MYYKIYFGEDRITIDQLPSREDVIRNIEDESPDDFLKFQETRGKKYDIHSGDYPAGKTLIVKGEVIEPRPNKLTI